MEHRLLTLAVVAIVLVSAFTFASTPTPAHAACIVHDVVSPFAENVNVVIGHSYTDYYYSTLTGDYLGGGTWIATFSPIGRILPANTRNILVDNSCGGTALLPLFTDGRENKNDAIQTAAVYCGVPKSGDVRVYALFDQKGVIAFTVTKAQLEAGVQKPAHPYLIKAAMGAELWRLQDGSLRIKRGTYFFDWPGC
jgi:hypothetical protein